MLICGANGFIGRNALEYFYNQDKYNIRAVLFKENDWPALDGVGYRWNDLRNEQEVKDVMEGVDIVLQFAATTTGSKDVVEQPWLHVTDNAVMNSWIFREALLNNVEHVVFPSCTVMYESSDWPVNEKGYDPKSVEPKYFGVARMKVFCEDMCEFYSREGNTKYTAIRHSNVYGPYDKFDLDKCHVVPAMVRKVVEAEDTLEVWGGGRAQRDIIYIDDLIRMVDLILKKQENKYELFNCGQNEALSIKEIIEKVSKLEKKKLELVYDLDKPDIPTVVVLDCYKAYQKLGWKPKVSYKKGLEKTIRWFKDNYGNEATV